MQSLQSGNDSIAYWTRNVSYGLVLNVCHNAGILESGQIVIKLGKTRGAYKIPQQISLQNNRNTATQ